MEFLLEISTEEMPPLHVKAGLMQLEEKLKNELSSANIEYSSIKTFGTCRRLVVLGDFFTKQRDRIEKILGPPKDIAFSKNGVPLESAKGFAKSKGVSTDKLEIIKTKKGEYIGLKKIVKGIPTQEILINILPKIITSLSFPKMMRWGENRFRFSRPIKNILCLFEGKVIPFHVGAVSASNFTTGHKIYSPQKLQVRSFEDYTTRLQNAMVIIDQDARRKKIEKKIKEKLATLEAQLLPDEQLLEKLTYEVEYPFVFVGSFPKEYLKLPMEILSTAMKEGQNLFSVIRINKQLPYFVGVADALRDNKFLIRSGNERVLKARLEDAKFFWEHDLKIPLSEKKEQLNRVVFQENLGSYTDKTLRLRKIVSYISDKLDVKKEKKAAIEAVELCKVDLITEMVREFPSLQGKVGGIYAREEKYPAVVWKAIYEHYQPVSLEDNPPSTLAGAILSIADKLDSIVGAVGIGIEVSGSKDPFGMRRNAQCICKIILEKRLNFSFSRLLDKCINVYEDRLDKEKKQIKADCIEFFKNRLQYIFTNQGYRYDLILASLAGEIDNFYYTYLKLKALDNLKNSPQFEPLIIVVKRVNNILRGYPPYKINEELFLEKEERELHTTFSIVKENIIPMLRKGEFIKAQKIIFKMRASINNFFDEVLVITEDKRIKKNRLALLQEISKLFSQVADYSEIVLEG